MAALRPGMPAPDFSLNDQDGNTVRLSDFVGTQPVVLIFYPADQTPGCTAQLCAARDEIGHYREAGVAVYGVNGADAASHARFIARHALQTPLLIDRGLLVAARYDAVLGLGPLRLIRRTVVGIDRHGRIAFYERGTPGTTAILGALAPQPA